MEQTKTNKAMLFMLCLVAAMGGLLFGYDYVVIGGAKPFYEAYFGLTGASMAWRAGFAMSSAVLGCIFGALSLGWIPDRYGRRRSLIFAAFMFTLSAIWTAFAHGYWSFIIARVIGGVGIGLASNVSPVYIAEISPARMRGRLVAVNQLTLVIGIFMAQLVNLLIYEIAPVAPDASVEAVKNSWNGVVGWRWMFGAETVPAALFFILAWIIPESPRWLASHGCMNDAVKIWTKLNTPDEERIVGGNEADGKSIPWKEFLKPSVAKVVLLGIFLAAFQQWCGLNVVFNYAEEIFKSAGYDVSGMMFNVVITGAVNFIFTIVAMFLVDKWGRRPLMITGATGMALINILIGLSYYFKLKGIWVLILVLAEIACYATTLAPVTWVVLSEIFPNKIRGTAMSIAVGALWISCYGLTLTFKPLNMTLGAAKTFWFYGLICVVGVVVIAMSLRETKGKTLESISND